MSTRATKKSVKTLVDEGVKLIAPDAKPISAKAMSPLLDAIIEVSEMATAQAAEVVTQQFVETFSDKKLTAAVENAAGLVVERIAEQFAATLIDQLVEQFSEHNPMDQVADKVAGKIADQVVGKLGGLSAEIRLK